MDGVYSKSFLQAPTLHIFGQGSWHDEAFIVGNLEGLVKLRSLIDQAVIQATASNSEGFTYTEDVMVNDGEHFDLGVFCTGPNFPTDAKVPYQDELTRGQSHGTTPWIAHYIIERNKRATNSASN